MSRALNYLGIARKAALIETGEVNSRLMIRKGWARLLILASDASENARKRAEGFVYEKGIPIAVVPFTKAELSDTTGKAGCSMAAITDAGLAQSFALALLQEYGEEYRGLASATQSALQEEKSRKRRSQARSRNKAGKRRNNA